MRRIEHPGPVAADRILTVDCALRRVDTTLSPGATLLDSLTAVLAANRASGAVASLRGGSFAPFVFVMPALSPTPAHAVYFSDRHEPAGEVRLESANLTVGRRDNQPWLHCHGTWLDRGGNRLGGHVLPNEAVISSPINACLWFTDGAVFDVKPNPETSFSLFEPTAIDVAASEGAGAFVMAVRSNEDLCTALEGECRARSIRSARIRGGVGSLVGASFDDGREVEPFVTEVFILDGKVETNSRGELAAQVDVCVVDYLGGLSEGRLRRGANPVLVTFEFAIEPITLG